VGGLKASIYFLSDMYESSTIFIKQGFPNTYYLERGKEEKSRGDKTRVDKNRKEKKRAE
jgi:hypothetical protein